MLKSLLIVLAVIFASELAFTESDSDHLEFLPESQVPAHRFSIASLNLQAYCLPDADSVDIESLAEFISEFEIVALQKIDRCGDAVALLDDIIWAVYAYGNEYDYILGPPIGNMNNYFAFIYRSNVAIPIDWYSFNDFGNITFRWSPLVVRFKLGDNGFDITLANISIDPASYIQEFDALSVLVDDIKNEFPDETDIIILGNMTSVCQDPQTDDHFKPLGQDSYIELISFEDTMRIDPSGCPHAQIIVASYSDELFWEESGILVINRVAERSSNLTASTSVSAPGYTTLAVVGKENESESGGTTTGGFCFFKSSSN